MASHARAMEGPELVGRHLAKSVGAMRKSPPLGEEVRAHTEPPDRSWSVPGATTADPEQNKNLPDSTATCRQRPDWLARVPNGDRRTQLACLSTNIFQTEAWLGPLGQTAKGLGSPTCPPVLSYRYLNLAAPALLNLGEKPFSPVPFLPAIVAVKKVVTAMEDIPKFFSQTERVPILLEKSSTEISPVGSVAVLRGHPSASIQGSEVLHTAQPAKVAKAAE
ncbi:hypothetical protein PtB15_13B389 [Puccinia triticina]|nr:hypothetical protein PtB15_13B389 [Puccinia triticina]